MENNALIEEDITKGYILGTIQLFDLNGEKLDIEIKDLGQGNYEFIMPDTDVYVDLVLSLVPVNPETYDIAYVLVFGLLFSSVLIGVLYSVRRSYRKYE